MSGTKTGITAVNEILFNQLEKLSNDDLTGDRLDTEIERSKAIKDISAQIIQSQQLAFNVLKHADDMGYNHEQNIPKMLEVVS